MADSKTRLPRGELVDKLAERTGLPKAGVDSVLKEFAAVVTEQCFEHDARVYLQGLGAFSVKDRPARTGTNPFTKKEYATPAKRVLVFKNAKENSRVAAE